MGFIFLAAGAILGGFVNGLTGFGFALMASGLWLQVLPPTQVVPLIVICMLTANLQSMPRVWRLIKPRRVLPLVLGGIPGVPFGVWLLPQVPLDLFKLAVAGIILASLLFSLAVRGRIHLSAASEKLHPLAGLLGGILGGLNGLSGVPLTIWAGLFGWSKQEKRGVFQGFNLVMAILTLGLFGWSGYLTRDLLSLTLIAVPLGLFSAFVGVRVFERMGNKGFSIVINSLLVLSALNLIVSVYSGEPL
ncbi:MAG: sulfite exporter TauE/SafE family protein [Rhodobacteraceae bacterium]|nr:sulfite exporter TauE/SafE family protein [Paracoccaceae bacterium]